MIIARTALHFSPTLRSSSGALARMPNARVPPHDASPHEDLLRPNVAHRRPLARVKDVFPAREPDGSPRGCESPRVRDNASPTEVRRSLRPVASPRLGVSRPSTNRPSTTMAAAAPMVPTPTVMCRLVGTHGVGSCLRRLVWFGRGPWRRSSARPSEGHMRTRALQMSCAHQSVSPRRTQGRRGWPSVPRAGTSLVWCR